jgi:septal ring factor EnvC (AmiA/AmiB activator)
VRALYKLTRAADAPVWAIGPDRSAAYRQAEAARRVILRDLEERRQIADDWVAASAAATRLEAAAAWVRFVRAPLPQRGWTRPVPGRVAAQFGKFREPVSGASLERTTLELVSRPGWNVVAPRAGRVLFAGATREGGTLVLAHEGDLVTVLVGVVPSVVTGQELEGGAVVGKAQGLRLGVSLRRGGRPIDPAPLWP